MRMIARHFWRTVALLGLTAGLAALTSAAPAQYSPATLGLHQAVQTNRTADALRYLAAGADVHVLDKAGRPALFWAVLFGNDALVAALLERGADPCWTSPDGATLLHEATRWPILEPTGARRSTGEQPSLAGKLRIIERLIRLGLDPNAVDSNGSTPLHIATGLPLGGPEPRAIVSLLVAAGSRPLATNAYALTPLDLARRRGASELATAMEKAQ